MWLQQLDGKPSEAAIRTAAGSDDAVVSAIASGQQIRFDLGDDRRGRTLAVDVEPFSAPGHSICRDIVISKFFRQEKPPREKLTAAGG
jgi:hypothetical protein